ncbi:EAL domain-containing protein [uncultured Pseudacidovorax sp.]|uniref:bifunctional diguanylate cyclase/phosphodiesterase n=1 Tax=uncultured Pseudacidovorax sp. TaxID=679313 RepID=UPI0025D73918|nr:EAL domain-containing protein [uncultured Pseudacidovorax sp.]
MSLLRRLWLSVLLAMFAVLLGTWAVSIATSRLYLQQQLLAQGADAAVSLAMSISQQGDDPAMAETLVNALFDSGHFQQVRYTDVKGQVVVDRNRGAVQPGADVPAWFTHLLPLQATPGEALVSNGWQQAGRVRVIASTQYAYVALWRGTLLLGALLALTGLLWGLGITALVRWLRRPLKHMADQADAVGNGQFHTIEEPRVTELRSMARALNRMVARVHAMFTEQAAQIRRLHAEATRDPVSRLPNREFFMGALRNALDDEAEDPAGGLLLLRVGNLMALNRQIGRERADRWLAAVAKALSGVLPAEGDRVLARLNGADFAYLWPGGSAAELAELARRAHAAVLSLQDARDGDLSSAFAPPASGFAPLPTGFGALPSDFGTLAIGEPAPGAPASGWADAGARLPAAQVDVAHGHWHRGESAGEVMARLDAALMQAEGAVRGIAEAAEPGSEAPVIGESGWDNLLQQALQEQRFTLVFYPVCQTDGRLIHHEAMLRMTPPPDAPEGSALLSAGQFMPAALRLGWVQECDLIATRLALDSLQRQPGPLAVNLSPRSLLEPSFLPRLDTLLRSHPAECNWLSFELSERGLEEHVDALAMLAQVLARHGCRLGVEHFGRQLALLPRLHELQLHYLKIDGSFVASVESSEGYRRLVQAMVEVARGLGVEAYAEQVSSAGQWRALASLGIGGVTGPAVTRYLNR